MRVALVSGYDWQVFGGVQSQVRDLAVALTEQGDTVRLIAPGPRPAPASKEALLIEATGPSLSLAVNGSRAPVSPGPPSLARSWRALRAFLPDIVHVHEPLLPGPPLVGLLWAGAPVVGTFHRAGTDPLYRLEGRLLGALARRRLVLATAVSSAAAMTAEEVLGPLGQLRLVPNGVELGRFAAVRKEAAGAGPKDPAGPVVAFLGRLEARKGLSVLLEALGLLESPPRLVVVGEGPERAALERQAAGRVAVSFLGALPDDEAAAVVAAADCFVAPAVGGESFGIVLLEAMAAGTAVLASDIPGYTLAAGGAARLFSAGDPAALAAGLEAVLTDGELRQRLVAAGTARARQCSITEVATTYRELYGLALERTPSGRGSSS